MNMKNAEKDRWQINSVDKLPTPFESNQTELNRSEVMYTPEEMSEKQR